MEQRVYQIKGQKIYEDIITGVSNYGFKYVNIGV